MQVTCFAFRWDEVLKRPNAQAIVDEMILTDDIDQYAVQLPDGIWMSDSANQHFEVVQALQEFSSQDAAKNYPQLALITELLSDGPSIDELGIAELTDHCYYISVSPGKAVQLSEAFNALNIDSLAETCAQYAECSTEDIKEWLNQWKGAFNFAVSKKLGLIGHCG